MNLPRVLRRLPPGAPRCAALVAGAGLLAQLLPPLAGPLERLSFDLPFLGRAPTPAPAVVAVYLDDISHQQLAQPFDAPWDRRLHAQLLTNLLAWEARAVVFDIVMDAPAPDPQADAAFESALQRARGKALLAARFDQTAPGIRRLILPLGRFRDASQEGWGLADLREDADRAVRRHFTRDPEWKDAASLAARAAALVSGRPVDAVAAGGVERWMRFHGPPGTLPQASYFEALQATNQTMARLFRDKVVFVGKGSVLGFTGAVQDGFRTPYSRAGRANMPGVDLHATQFLNLRQGDWLERAGVWAEAWLVLLLGAALGGGLAWLRPWTALGVGAAAATAIGVIGWTLAAHTGMWFDWALPCFVQTPLAIAGALALRTQTASAPTPPTEGATAEFRPPGPRGPEPETAPRVPDHELLRLIGSGSYGEVWLARSAMGSLRAVKLVRRRGPGRDRQFEREFSGLQKFEPVSRLHEGFVDILHVGRDEVGGWFYYVMELADAAAGERSGGVTADGSDGPRTEAKPPDTPPLQHPGSYTPRTLQHDLRERGPLPLAECARLGVALCEALEFLHARGLVHRDLKPSNIIFVQGRPKLADIGLVADAEEAGSFVGTAGYIPPEGPAGPASDLFSLGRVLYVAATGLAVARFPEWPAPPHGAAAQDWGELRAVLLRACAAEPRQRYDSAAATRTDLSKLAGRPGTTG